MMAAQLKIVDEFSADPYLSDEFVVCRTINHSFDPYTVRTLVTKGSKTREYYVTLVCSRCGVTKAFTMRNGRVVRRHGYVYPKGYLVSGGLSPQQKEAVGNAFIDLYTH